MLAFYINLAKRTDRRAFMETQLAALGMDVERLEATTPETIEHEDLAPLSMKEAGAKLSSIEVAVSISHFKAWKRMLTAGRRHVLVLEDDVRLSGMLPSFLSALESEAPDIGLLRLETRLSRVLLHHRAERGPPGFSLHMPLSYEAGSAAYVISADSAARILASPDRFNLPIDDILFSLKSPFRNPARLRVAVPALALFQLEASPEYDVPDSIPASDSQASRELRYAEEAQRPKPTGWLKLRREIRRMRQIGSLPKALWLRALAVKTIVPFVDGNLTAPPSAVPPRA